MAMGRPKKHNRHLPERMRFQHGMHYRVVKNVWTPLDPKFGAALKKWAELECAPEAVTTFGQALDGYIIDELPNLAEETQRQYRLMSATLRDVFGDTSLDAIESGDIAQYLKKRSKKKMANREIALMSSVYVYAMGLGFAKANPCRCVRRNKEKKRTRIPTQAELLAVMLASEPTLHAMILLTLATGVRESDLLKLDIPDLEKRGIEVRTKKTSAPICFTWTDDLRAVIAPAIGDRQLGPVFLTKRRRKRWTASGLDTMWGRLCEKCAIEDLHWHDLRAWAITMVDRTRGRDAAAEFAGHASKATTDIYLRDRSMREVEPLNTRQLLGV